MYIHTHAYIQYLSRRVRANLAALFAECGSLGETTAATVAAAATAAAAASTSGSNAPPSSSSSTAPTQSQAAGAGAGISASNGASAAAAASAAQVKSKWASGDITALVGSSRLFFSIIIFQGLCTIAANRS